ncbi:hypothetical protein M1293_03980 [Candidatus Parvarchaeota archaeon]|nr:hypothetical protein [Candidatus Parvarchaeota archaeon]
MEEAKSYEDERNAFLSQVEELKKKIVNIETNLGIDIEELKKIPQYSPPKSQTKQQATEKQEPAKQTVSFQEVPKIDIHIPSGSEIVERHDDLPAEKMNEEIKAPPPLKTISTKDLNEQINELRDKAKQVEEISQIVESIRAGRREASKRAQEPAHVKSVQKEQVPATKDETAKKQTTTFQPRDLNYLPVLIKNLNELIRTNTDISIQLRRVIDETRRNNNSSKMSELIRKLAYLASSNG